MSSRLRQELKDKEYRDAFVAATVRNGIAFQIRAMRNSRMWDQKQLAQQMGNANLQPVVSRYENPDYGRYSISTLLELAKAFDVGLTVRFSSFSDLIANDEELPEASLDVPSYSQDEQAQTECLRRGQDSCQTSASHERSGFYIALFGGGHKMSISNPPIVGRSSASGTIWNDSFEPNANQWGTVIDACSSAKSGGIDGAYRNHIS